MTGGYITPNDCEVNEVLATGISSYLVSGLTPGTTYYFLIPTYSSNCARATRLISFLRRRAVILCQE